MEIHFNHMTEFILLPSHMGNKDRFFTLFLQDLEAALPLIELYKDKLVAIGEVSRIL